MRDWCISRQLWWGHQIPVWYDGDGEPAASLEDLEIGAPHPKTGKPIVRRDDDVLDTWASSWLWPFSTLGWPEETNDLARYYPTQFLSTAREIIYLWVARMVMAGYEFLGKCPFDVVYMHATVLDDQGRRMSKSLGNGIDPNEMIAQYGADAVRFTLALLTTEGQDVKLAPTKFELGRNFMNKIWNSARFVLMNVPEGSQPSGEGSEDLADRWILARLNTTIDELTDALQGYRYHDSAQTLYSFVWNDFCDWYLEASKPRLQSGDAACASTLLFVLDRIVHMIQPFAPYLAAELAEVLGHKDPIANASWPVSGARDETAEAEFGRLQETISAIRKIRNENRVDDKTTVDAHIKTDAPELLTAQAELIQRLARVGAFQAGADLARPGLCATEVRGGDEIYVPLEGLIDVGEEKARKEKELEKARGYAVGIEKKLANENFVSRAKPEVVERERERLVEANEKIAKLEQALKDLG